jgi:hypothetical protein
MVLLLCFQQVRLGTGKMSGPAATRVLRTQHGYGGCIAALTGYVDEDTYKECMSCMYYHLLYVPCLYLV